MFAEWQRNWAVKPSKHIVLLPMLGLTAQPTRKCTAPKTNTINNPICSIIDLADALLRFLMLTLKRGVKNGLK